MERAERIGAQSGQAESTVHVPRRVGTPLPIVVRVEGDAPGLPELRIGAGRCVVGAGRGADLVVPHETVSRRHLELQVVPEGVAVRDLGSRNGTFINGHRIESITLFAGARITIGTVELSVQFDLSALSAGERETSYGQLVAASPRMHELFGTLRRIEGTLVNVLLVGESGTGKELIARAIHEHSAKSEQPFVAVNCGALQRELVRSELFGHRRGAFTGAVEHRQGAFQRAHGGTLFLDEVGELPLDVQPILLRALQQREVVRVGDDRPETVDVRVLAATHRDLSEMAAAGEFREDLYYRLNVVRLGVPPLRERPEDIELLACVVARRFGIAELPKSVLATLHAHSWPGNVRELAHAIEAYAAIGELPLLTQRSLRAFDKLLGDHLDVTRVYDDLKHDLQEVFMVTYLRKLLAHTGGNVAKASRLSGIERSYLNKLVIQHGLRP